jgi:hypothetical protein
MDQIEMEKEQLDSLIGKSLGYEVKYKTRQPVKGWGRFIGRTVVVAQSRQLEIKPPTLAVMDRLSRVSLDLEQISSELSEAANGPDLLRGSLSDPAEKMARYIAIATLGEDYYIREQNIFGRFIEKDNDDTLNELSEFLFTWLTPSELFILARSIFSLLGLENFLGSMGLLKGTRTAAKKKSLIE